MSEESVIMIPKVQRDYAYGRKEQKVEEVLDGMLTTMFDAIKENSKTYCGFFRHAKLLIMPKTAVIAGLYLTLFFS